MNNENFSGWCFALPLLLGVFFFHILPALACGLLSLFQWPLTSAPVFVGMENYANLLGFKNFRPDPLFIQALGNTFFMALAVPFQVAGSFVFALLLKHRRPGFQLLRLIVFLPTLVSPVALYILWRSILYADIGLAGRLLDLVGLHMPLWLENPFWSKPAVMLVLIWETLGGFQMLFFLAGIRQIPDQLFDMARLDGFSLWQRIRTIYWPWLKPLTLFNLCLGLIAALQGGFEIAYILTGGGPLRSTTTLSYLLFENAFQWQRAGYASAIGIIIFFITTPLLILSIRRKPLD